jgi:hypothetical protein
MLHEENEQFEEAISDCITDHLSSLYEDYIPSNIGELATNKVFKTLTKELDGNWFKRGEPKKISDYIIKE